LTWKAVKAADQGLPTREERSGREGESKERTSTERVKEGESEGEIITHSPLRDLKLPGCHFDTVRGIKDIPRARHFGSAINLRTDDYADSSREPLLPRRRNRSASLDGATDYREEWFAEPRGMRVASRSDAETVRPGDDPFLRQGERRAVIDDRVPLRATARYWNRASEMTARKDSRDQGLDVLRINVLRNIFGVRTGRRYAGG